MQRLTNLLSGSLLCSLLAVPLHGQDGEADAAVTTKTTEADWSDGKSMAERMAYFSGQAEVSRYDVSQSRYGSARDGYAVLIFVTEPFLPKTQVKAERPVAAELAVDVLKINDTRRFPTGLYDYSMMRSVFTAEQDIPAALKVTCSVQDWCGHAWLQVNLTNGQNNAYRFLGHSYFQGEAEQDTTLEGVVLEDALWTTLRLAPEKLPVGAFRIGRSVFDSRLNHEPLQAEAARGEMKRGDELSDYTVRYSRGRSLTIRFQTAFPHRIESWTEMPRDGASADDITSGKRTHTERVPYWSKNAKGDAPLRETMGLPPVR